MPTPATLHPNPFDLPTRPTGELLVEIRDSAGVVGRHALVGRAIVGRAADARVRLDRGTVSRQHAEILPDPFGRWWIRDLGSRNGLLQDGGRVREVAIRDGDEFQVGDFTLGFRLSDATRAPQPHHPPHRPAAGPDASFNYTTVVPLADVGGGPDISLARELGSPRVAAAHLSLLLELGRELVRTESAEGRLVQLCHLLVRPDFQGIWAAAMRISPDAPDAPQMLCPPQSAGWHGGGNGHPHAHPPVSRSLVRTVIERGSPALAGNTPAATQLPEMVEMSMVASVRPMSAACCPLQLPRAAGDATDLLYVVFPPGCATGEWLAIVELAAEQYRSAELAWAARREAVRHVAVERDLDQARQIQHRLVPRDLRTPGLDVAVGFQPCRWVGGDYADAALLPDGRVFLAVADVCGKGLAAALVASSLHTLVRSTLDEVETDGGLDLARLLRRLNRYLTNYLEGGKFVTMACAVVDPRTGAVEHANAGHPPTLVVSTAGGTRDLASAANLPLGVEEGEFHLHRDALAAGELLAMYTDGLTEARGPDGEMVGMGGLRSMVGRIHAESADRSLTDARARMTAWVEATAAGRLQDDDLTYLLARRG